MQISDLNENTTFKVIDDDGIEVECEILFTFESDVTNRNYIVYTDDTTNDDGDVNVYASIYDPTIEDSKLLPIETQEEWSMIESILGELMDYSLGEME
ncbi:MAG: DUF1292 domain-containing protein [Acutalibacteraceae bacterium]